MVNRDPKFTNFVEVSTSHVTSLDMVTFNCVFGLCLVSVPRSEKCLVFARHSREVGKFRSIKGCPKCVFFLKKLIIFFR